MTTSPIFNAALVLAVSMAMSGCAAPSGKQTSMTAADAVPVQKQDTAKVEADVMRAFQGLVHASKALDEKRYLDYIDREKFTGLGADGKVWHSFKDLENIIVPGFRMVDKIISLEFPVVKITVINPSTAILSNEFRQTIRLKNADLVRQSGGGTQVWAKSGDAWKLVSISASDSPGEAPAAR